MKKNIFTKKFDIFNKIDRYSMRDAGTDHSFLNELVGFCFAPLWYLLGGGSKFLQRTLKGKLIYSLIPLLAAIIGIIIFLIIILGALLISKFIK
ncbi:MAG: hypothetical protein WCO55_04050 [Candidatus Falkowbacteria bacterium]